MSSPLPPASGGMAPPSAEVRVVSSRVGGGIRSAMVSREKSLTRAYGDHDPFYTLLRGASLEILFFRRRGERDIEVMRQSIAQLINGSPNNQLVMSLFREVALIFTHATTLERTVAYG